MAEIWHKIGNMSSNILYLLSFFVRFFEVIFRNHSIENIGTVAASKIAWGGVVVDKWAEG